MRTTFASLLIATVAVAAIVTPAVAEPAIACAERTKILSRLAADYGETRQSIGLGANNAVIEVFASDKTGTWTITVTKANGVTCLIASGQAFEAVTEDLASLLDSDA